ncbi:DUF2062 domain-containing protein [Sphingomonas donggukensis]|uniref:DUF2062 domain-containing protein n=1 Tax=Sphingomonas donggukensis TaxID=2949093 RepID=A0ABY4TXM1_9SPHN|nr:DUF2062 domain-containing protein [Sphingomonas donggukensis]URW77153.1 DUF2062 domain-containing protein [Sphingomonas donggukensis]
MRAWAQRNFPTRESMEQSRILRPVAHRVLAPELWRFTRRSVPRGVALGVVTGILIPMGQIPASAVLALPLRANIPAAALTTFITNPFTTPFLWAGAYWVGRKVLRLDTIVPGSPIRDQVDANIGWLQWFFAEAGPALIVGLLVVTLIGAIAGYGLSVFGWRMWIARKWRSRHGKGT